METFSQFKEDVLVWEYFGQKPSGFFVEVGANDPVLFSQTWLLEQRGWRGILVEPLSSRCERLRAMRAGSKVFQVAVGSPEERGEMVLHVTADDMFSSLQARERGPLETGQETVTVTTLDDVLAEAGGPAVDFLSIDVEGMEISVLEGFSLERVRPKLVLVEDHLKSLSLHRHLIGRGYKLVKRTGCNNWYIPHELPFPFTTGSERLALFKRIWFHTPLAVVREWLRGVRKRLKSKA